MDGLEIKMDKPEDLKEVGTCKNCGDICYYSESQPTNEHSNVGDYDFVCYPCQFKLMDAGEWQGFKATWLNR
jgi:hypothetical protein